MNQVSLDVDMIDKASEASIAFASTVKETQKGLAKLAKTLSLMEVAFKRLEALDVTVRVSPGDWAFNITFTGDTSRFAEVWRLLRSQGYTPDTRPVTKVKSSSFNTYWHKPDYASIWFSFSSSVCKRVQVGVETKEVPVYEVQCESLPDMLIDEEAPRLEAP